MTGNAYVKRNVLARPPNHTYNEHGVFCIANLHVAVNNIKLPSVVTEKQQWLPLECCAAAEYFLLLSTI